MTDEATKYLSKDYDNYSLKYSEGARESGRPVVITAPGEDSHALLGALTVSPTHAGYLLELYPAGFQDYYYGLSITYAEAFGPPEELITRVQELIEGRDNALTKVPYKDWKQAKDLLPHTRMGADRK